MIIDPKIKPLHFAIRLPVLAKYLGQMMLVLGVLTCVPTVVALASGNGDVALRYGIVVGLFALLGWLGSRLDVNASLQRNEALAISALMFALPPFVMTFPLMAYNLSFLDALFEVVSGVTTTGLSTLPTVENMPAAFLFSRAWMQWVGGLGVVVLALALLLEPSAASSHLGFDKREADDIAGGTKSHARKGLITYVILTAAGTFLIWLFGAGWFDALVHSMAAVSTGGFSNYDNSLAGFGSVSVATVVIVMCFAGAVPFNVYYRGLYGDWGGIVKNPQLIMLLVVSVATTALMFFFMSLAGIGDVMTRLKHAFIMAVSAQSTAGFSSMATSDLDNASILVMIGAMFFGGGLGSTAGGIKVLRLIILLRLLHLTLIRASIPVTAKLNMNLGKTELTPREIEATLAVVLGYVATILFSWLIFLAYGYDPLISLFEVTSAVGTAGISAGLTGPDLEPALKLLLCFDMLMGRVETIALLILLFPGTWIGKRREWR